MKLTLQQACSPLYIYDQIKKRGYKEVKQAVFHVADLLDEDGEKILAKQIRACFWDSKRKADRESNNFEYTCTQFPKIPKHLEKWTPGREAPVFKAPPPAQEIKAPPVQKVEEKPKKKKKRAPRRTREELELTPFGGWLEKYQVVSVAKMAKEFKFAAANVSIMRYKSTRKAMLRASTLRKVILAVCKYSNTPRDVIVKDLASASTRWEALCRQAYPEAFVQTSLTVYKDGNPTDVIQLPIDVYDLTTTLITIATEHGYDALTIGE